MSIFSDKLLEALESGKFICSKCGTEMRFKDKWEDRLICPKCGYELDTDLYGIESEEEYEALYPVLNPDEGEQQDKEENKSSEETK